MDFLIKPGWSLIPWKNLDIEEDDIKESNKISLLELQLLEEEKEEKKI